MANRAARIAIPILKAELGKKPGIALTTADCKSVSRKIRDALSTHRHADGSAVHQCVIEEWANEADRRRAIANAHNERQRTMRYRSQYTPKRREIEFQKKRLERSNYSDAALKKISMARGFDLAVAMAASMLRRFTTRHT